MVKRGKFLTDDPTPRNVKKAGLARTRIRGLRTLLKAIFPRKFTIDVLDESDVTWREQGRKQRRTKKVIDYKKGTILNNLERQGVINSIIKSGDPNSGNDFNILALELMRALPSLEAVTNMIENRPNEYNTIARAIKGLKFIDSWKNIFPQRFLSEEFVRRNITSVMMYLIGTTKFPLSPVQPLYGISGKPMILNFLDIVERGLRPGKFTLDIAAKRLLPDVNVSSDVENEKIWKDLKSEENIEKTIFGEDSFIKEWKKRFKGRIRTQRGLSPEELEELESARVIDEPLLGEEEILELPGEPLSMEEEEEGEFDVPELEDIPPGEFEVPFVRKEKLPEKVLDVIKKLLATKGEVMSGFEKSLLSDLVKKGTFTKRQRPIIKEIISGFTKK